MLCMKHTLILYYSFEGNSEWAATCLAEKLGEQADIGRLTVRREPPKRGFFKFLIGGRSAIKGIDPGLNELTFNPADYQQIVLVFPIWAGTFAPAIGALLKKYPLEGKTVHLVASSASGSEGRAFDNIAAALGGSTIASSVCLRLPGSNQAGAEEKLSQLADALKA